MTDLTQKVALDNLLRLTNIGDIVTIQWTERKWFDIVGPIQVMQVTQGAVHTTSADGVAVSASDEDPFTTDKSLRFTTYAHKKKVIYFENHRLNEFWGEKSTDKITYYKKGLLF